ncbi:hypothetical protein KYT24_004358 [Salmonella enterica]|nr:hypothetical protein [Salmonella enterica]
MDYATRKEIIQQWREPTRRHLVALGYEIVPNKIVTNEKGEQIVRPFSLKPRQPYSEGFWWKSNVCADSFSIVLRDLLLADTDYNKKGTITHAELIAAFPELDFPPHQWRRSDNSQHRFLRIDPRVDVSGLYENAANALGQGIDLLRGAQVCYVKHGKELNLPPKADLPIAPAHILERMRKPEVVANTTQAPAMSEHARAVNYVAKSLKLAAEALAAYEGEGGRNNAFRDSVFKFATFVQGGYVTGQQIRDELTAAAVAAGLDRAEIVATFKSAYRAGVQRVQHPNLQAKPQDAKQGGAK